MRNYLHPPYKYNFLVKIFIKNCVRIVKIYGKILIDLINKKKKQIINYFLNKQSESELSFVK